MSEFNTFQARNMTISSTLINRQKLMGTVVNLAFPYLMEALLITRSEAEFKEFKRWLKFKPRLKYGWFHLKLYQRFRPALNFNRVLADLSRGSNSLNSTSDSLKWAGAQPWCSTRVIHPNKHGNWEKTWISSLISDNWYLILILDIDTWYWYLILHQIKDF